MIDQIVLDRVRLVREMIAEYEEEIDRERSRLEMLRVEWAKAKFAAEELEEQGRADEARKARLEEHELQHRIEDAEAQIDRMEELLSVFRRKLLEVQRMETERVESQHIGTHRGT